MIEPARQLQISMSAISWLELSDYGDICKFRYSCCASIPGFLIYSLGAAAKKSGSAQIAMLAVSAKLDAFTKVKAAIDEMLVELKKQQKDEFEHKEWCNKELRKNSLDHKKKTYKVRSSLKLLSFSPNVERLVLRCIDSYDSESTLIFKLFSRTTRSTILCTAQISKFQEKVARFFRQNLSLDSLEGCKGFGIWRAAQEC